MVRVERDLGDMAELDILVADRGAAGLDTVRSLKADRDRRPALDQRAKAEPSGNDQGDDRNRPYPGQAGPSAGLGRRRRPSGTGPDGSEPLNLASPLRRIPHQARVKGAGREHRQHDDGGKAGDPRPGLDRRQGAELHQRTTIETMKTSMFDQRPMKSTKR